MMAAYDIAKQRKHFGRTISAKNSNATYFSYKNRMNNNSATAVDQQNDYDHGFETASVCSLTVKIDENAEKIDTLTDEIKELKALLHQNHQTINQLLMSLKADGKQSKDKRSLHKHDCTLKTD
jgi:transcription initiation factor IIE alpha subunit